MAWVVGALPPAALFCTRWLTFRVHGLSGPFLFVQEPSFVFVLPDLPFWLFWQIPWGWGLSVASAWLLRVSFVGEVPVVLSFLRDSSRSGASLLSVLSVCEGALSVCGCPV